MEVVDLKREIIAEGRTVDEALEKICAELGIEKESAEFEIISLPKKTLFGMKTVPAKVKLFLPASKEDAAKAYLTEVLEGMGVTNLTITRTEEEEGKILFTLDGDGLGVAIGRRGETLDALQYLTSLVINRIEGDYLRISIDVGDYRKKREETLVALANKIASQALKHGRNVTLEPMNPYERRIIHSAVQPIEGVTSRSIGEEPNRKVIICPEKKSGYRGERNNSRPRRDNNRPHREDSPRSDAPAEQKQNTVKIEAADKPLYGKIDLD